MELKKWSLLTNDFIPPFFFRQMIQLKQMQSVKERCSELMIVSDACIDYAIFDLDLEGVP